MTVRLLLGCAIGALAGALAVDGVWWLPLAYGVTCGAVGAFVAGPLAERVWWLMPGACPRCGTRRHPLPRPWRPLVCAWLWLEIWRLPEDLRWLWRVWTGCD